MSLLFILIIIFIFVIIINCLIKFYNKDDKKFPPGPLKLPLVGSYFSLLYQHRFLTHIALLKLCKKYKTNILGFYIGNVKSVCVISLDLCKEVLIRNDFIDRPVMPILKNRELDKVLGIFFTSGPFWHEQRRFSLRNMRDFGFGRRHLQMEETIEHEIHKLIDYLTERPKTYDPDLRLKQGVVKMPYILFLPTFNCIHYLLSGLEFHDYRQIIELGKHFLKNVNFIDATGNAITIFPWLKYVAPEYFGWNHSIRESDYIKKFLKNIIQEHKDTYIEGHNRDFIDAYWSEIKGTNGEQSSTYSFTEEQMIQTLTDYMTPAPGSITQTLHFLFANLINFPEIQTKIQKEIDQAVAASRLPTLDDRINLPYTEASLREIMRRHTVIPLCIPRVATKDTTLDNYFIPKGTVIYPNVWAAHMDPDYWVDPENFRPERWLDSDGKLGNKDPTLGFGAGKRVCVGETFSRNILFLILSAVMQNFTLKSPDGVNINTDIEVHKPGFITTLESYWIEFVPRNS